MAYTSTDLANVDAAITSLISGDRIVEITRDGFTTKYHPADLSMLRQLRKDILKEINAPTASTTVENPRTVVTLTRKGL